MCLFRDKEQLNLLRQQMLESTKVSENLRKELSVYEKLYKLSYEGRNIELQTDGMYLWYSEIWKPFSEIISFIFSPITLCHVVYVY